MQYATLRRTDNIYQYIYNTSYTPSNNLKIEKIEYNVVLFYIAHEYGVTLQRWFQGKILRKIRAALLLEVAFR